MVRTKPTLLYVVNVDWFFLSHWLPLARASRDEGFEVFVVAADTGRGIDIQRKGFHFIPFPIDRKGLNPLREVNTLLSLATLYQRVKPDLVHHITVKPVIYGSLVARLRPTLPVVNAVTGLGFTFSRNRRASLLGLLVRFLYRAALGKSKGRVVFENPDDRQLFIHLRFVDPKRTVLIKGAGVDCVRFHPTPEPSGPPVVMLPSRMLWDKGVGEFVKAAELLRGKARFVLVGGTDDGNPAAISTSQLRTWHQAGVVEWWGHQSEMHNVLPQAHIIVLPSYREGLPKVLLEAAAVARPIVATDVPGCREIVKHGVNGLLVPLQSPIALAEAIERLLESPEFRTQYGQAGRRLVESQFSEDIVAEEYLSVYRELLKQMRTVGNVQ